MVLGALVDAGLSMEELESQLRLLPVRGWRIDHRKVVRNGISATRVDIVIDDKEKTHRYFPDIREMILKASLDSVVKEKAIDIFSTLARVEGEIHGIAPEKVHFHEVGAVDAILDIVGAVVGMELLKVRRVYASPVSVGRGFVTCEHGILPVPSPATAALLSGHRLEFTECQAELTTPTGAAILTSLIDRQLQGEMPVVYQTIGYGAGSRELPDRPNVLRIFIGEEETFENVWVVETSIDDMNPEHYEYVQEKLFDGGALDVTLSPLIMKKGRPGTEVKVLIPFENRERIVQVLFRETSTFGVRFYPVSRSILERTSCIVTTRYGRVRVKIARNGTHQIKVSPEAVDCIEIAKNKSVPLDSVYEEARRAYRDSVAGREK
jgi:hypothetical protein